MGSFRDYWRKWTFRAWQDTCAMLGLESRGKAVVKIVIAVVGLVVVYKLLGDKPAATEDVVLRTGAFAAILLAFPIVYGWKFIAAPYRLDAEQQDIISDLRTRLAPGIKLSFHPESDGVDQVPVKILKTLPGGLQIQAGDGMGTYLRLRVNAASTKSVFGCTAFLTRLQKQKGSGEIDKEIQLRGPINLNGEKPFDVHPGAYFPLWFASCTQGGDKLELPGGRFVLDNAIKDYGTYLFTITAVGDGVPGSLTVAVVWAGQWDKIEAYEIPNAT